MGPGTLVGVGAGYMQRITDGITYGSIRTPAWRMLAAVAVAGARRDVSGGHLLGVEMHAPALPSLRGHWLGEGTSDGSSAAGAARAIT